MGLSYDFLDLCKIQNISSLSPSMVMEGGGGSCVTKLKKTQDTALNYNETILFPVG